LIVFDASAAVELVLMTRRADAIAARVFSPYEKLHAPHVVDLEVAQSLRRLALGREITMIRATQALEDFGLLNIERYPHPDLLHRVWELRSALSAYDAAYVALAEFIDAPLLTCDERLSRSHGHAAKIELIGAIQ
jgi:predicted nucleic acid-binding protein